MLPLSNTPQPSDLIGIGYKSRYFAELAAGHPDIGWLEIHAENYMMEGGPRREIMMELAQKYPISCHGVGLSIGAEIGLDPVHIERLRHLMDWLKPVVFSEHLAWSTHSTGYYNDLLPLPYTHQTRKRVVDHINQVQDALGRQMLLENPSSYLIFQESEMPETEFIARVQSETGCGLLLDVNNVFVSAKNLKLDPYDYLDTYPLEHVQEIHLGGHESDQDEDGQPLLIDAHNNPVVEAVWTLYDYVLGKTGAIPSLVEWDNDLPKWPVLRDEARRAAFHISSYIGDYRASA